MPKQTTPEPVESLVRGAVTSATRARVPDPPRPPRPKSSAALRGHGLRMAWDPEDSSVLQLAGELDASSVPSFRRAIGILASAMKIDCRGVAFIDSVGLAALVDACRLRRGRRVANPSPAVLRLLDLARLSELVLDDTELGRGALHAGTRGRRVRCDADSSAERARVVPGARDREGGEAALDAMFVQTAEAFDTAGQTLTLRNIGPQTLYFSDRPQRVVGHLDTTGFVSEWTMGSDNFRDDPPNAVLAFEAGDGDAAPEDAVVVLENPEMVGRDLRYTVTVLAGTVPAVGEGCVLFIDPLARPLTSMSKGRMRRGDAQRGRRGMH